MRSRSSQHQAPNAQSAQYGAQCGFEERGMPRLEQKVVARRRLEELGYSEKQMRKKLDQVSAVLMLEHYLRFRAGQPHEPDGSS